MHPPRPVLILSDGDLPSLLACAAAANDRAPGPVGRPPPAVLPCTPEDPGGSRRSACQRQAESYAIMMVNRLAREAGVPAAGPSVSNDLLEAAEIAKDERLDAVIWPVHAGPGPDPDLDLVAESVDRALLVSRLARLDRQGRGVDVLTPYVDFVDEQIADLALDMDLPVWTCWWWDGRGAAAERERDRWLPVLAKAGWVDRRSAGIQIPPLVTGAAAPRRMTT